MPTREQKPKLPTKKAPHSKRQQQKVSLHWVTSDDHDEGCSFCQEFPISRAIPRRL